MKGSSTLSGLRFQTSSAFSRSISTFTSQATDKASSSTRSTADISTQQTPTAIASPIPPESSSESHTLSRPAKIGLGVGVPVLVVSVALAVILWWYRRRAQHKATEDSKIGSSETFREDGSPARDYGIMGYAPHELDDSGPKVQRSELPSRTTIPRGELMGSQSAAQKPYEARRGSGQLQNERVELAGTAAEKQRPLLTGFRSHE